MASPKTRGISLVRNVKVSEPDRKEPIYRPRQLTVRCNAEIPFSHKAFQSQYFYERDEESRTNDENRKAKKN